jgi:hypothetical protein
MFRIEFPRKADARRELLVPDYDTFWYHFNGIIELIFILTHHLVLKITLYLHVCCILDYIAKSQEIRN